MSGFLRYAYAPAMMVGFDGAAVWAIEAGRPHAWLMALLLTAIAVSLLVERIIPYEPTWNEDRGDTARDVVHGLINEASSYLVAGFIPALTWLSPVSGLWPTAWPLWAQLLIAIIVADCGISLFHWLSHRSPLLWRFHAVHHSVTRLYGFNGLMKHPVHQLFETVAGTTPLLVIGMPLDIGFLLGFAVAVQLLLQHSNVDMRIGPLRHVLALAPVHRFHHQKWAGVGDVNFGLFTVIWDHLLGTAVYRPDKRFTCRDLGIGTQPDYPARYWAQLGAPFRSRRSNSV